MKFCYNLDSIVKALAYTDLKGLLKLIEPKIFINGEPSVSEMEEIFKEKIMALEDKNTFKQIESLMLSCARENSIGY